MSQKIGKFEVLEKIGEGGFGVIFKGRDPYIKRIVAIKSCTSEDPEIRSRFAQEAQIAGNLQHRHIVTVYDFGEEQGVPYLVQEYLSGEDLDRKIKRREYIPFPEKLLYLVQVARGLEYAHSQGVVHRDIKPANIRILDDGTTKIMDFGIAKLANQESGLTQTGMTLGTASYLAPEQIRGEPVDSRTDIFSYGVMAYELLTYRRPFVGQHMSTILYQILNEEPPPPSRFAPGLPARLDALVTKCLQKHPDRRYDDVRDLMADLDALLKERRRLESGGVTRALEAEDEVSTRVLRAADPVPSDPSPASSVAVPAAPRVPESPPVALHRPGTLDDLELDASFDGSRTPHSISTTQAVRSREFAWGRWAASVVALAALGLAAFLYHRQELRRAEAGVEAGALTAEADRESSGELLEEPLQEVTAPGADDAGAGEAAPAEEAGVEAGEEAAVGGEGTETAEAEAPPPPTDGTLVFPAAWNPRIQVVIGDGSNPIRLDRERRVQLPEGTYPLEFGLYDESYSDARAIDVTVRPGEEQRVRVPILPPAILRVQPRPTSPSDTGYIALGNRRLGPTGLQREYRVPPGRYTLQIFRDLADEEPAIRESIELSSRQRLVASFSYRTNDVILSRSPASDR